MSSEILREHLHRVSFHPITLFLPSGKTITVSNLDVATVEAVGTRAD